MSPDLQSEKGSSTGSSLSRAGTVARASAAGPGRVLSVLHLLWSGQTGGMERAVYQLVREQLAGSTVAPAVLFAGPGGPYHDRLAELGCPVESLGLPHARSLRHLTAGRRAMRGVDVHHFHAAEPLLMAASMSCRGVTRVYTHRGGFVDGSFRRQARFRVAGPLMRASFHGFSGNTAHGARSGARLLGISPARFRVTYNGIEFSLLEPHRTAAEVRAELGLGSELVLGTAAILKDWKRIDRLLRAFPALQGAAAGPVRLLVVGDGPERPRLERLAAELGIAADVVFAGLRDHIADYLQVMDVFSLPSSERESFGNAAVEAMAVGVPPVVFADSPGLAEHVEDGRTGLIAATQDEFTAALRRLLEDAAARREMGARARAAIRERYTLARSAAAYDELYAAALAARRGG
jgi:glycosyltransferase involved in cell wall biosynthesis